MTFDSDNDHPMRTPPTNSPPSSADERSPPASPQLRPRNFLTDLGPGVMMQVNEFLGDDDSEGNEPSGKKKREEREFTLAAKAEQEKLLDKDWRDEWLKRWNDESDESDMKSISLSTSTTPKIQGAADKGKDKEKTS